MATNYSAPVVITSFNNVPRFGHTSDLAGVVIEGNLITYGDYLSGIVFVGGVILGMTFVWMLSLLFLKLCSGGVAAGGRMNEDIKLWRQSVMRFLVLSCCVLSAACGVVFLVRFHTSIESTFNSVTTGVTFLSTHASDVTQKANQLLTLGVAANTTRSETVAMLDKGICSFDGGNGNPYPELEDQAEELVTLLNDQLKDFAQEDLSNMTREYSSEFVGAEKQAKRVVDVTKDYASISWYSVAVIALSILLSLGGYMAWFGPHSRLFFCLQTWIILPLYFTVVLISAVVLAVLGPVLVANSDLCLGGPEKSPESFLKTVMNAKSLTPYTQEVLNYYVFDQCQSDYSGYASVSSLDRGLDTSLLSLQNLKNELETNKASIALGVCQGSNIEALDPLINVLNDAINSFSFMNIRAAEAVRMLECEPIHDLYVNFYRDGVCRNLPSAVSWMFATMACIVFFGMGIFLLRGALLPSIDPSHPKDKDINYYDKRSDDKTASKTISPERKKKTKTKKRSNSKEVFTSRKNDDFSSSDEEDDSMLLSVASTTKSNGKKKPTKKVLPFESSSDEEWQSDSSSDSSQGYNQKYRRKAK